MVSKIAAGRFEVKLELQTASELSENAGIGRRTLSKTFEGDLQGVSCGEMMTVMTAVQGSMAYVALEKFSGSLGALNGSFIMQHSSQMVRGVPYQSIQVVPDSGTEQFIGLFGDMTIDIRNGEHFYIFKYGFSDTNTNN